MVRPINLCQNIVTPVKSNTVVQWLSACLHVHYTPSFLLLLIRLCSQNLNHCLHPRNHTKHSQASFHSKTQMAVFRTNHTTAGWGQRGSGKQKAVPAKAMQCEWKWMMGFSRLVKWKDLEMPGQGKARTRRTLMHSALGIRAGLANLEMTGTSKFLHSTLLLLPQQCLESAMLRLILCVSKAGGPAVAGVPQVGRRSLALRRWNEPSNTRQYQITLR